jgi:hypothetical protein
MSQLRQIPGSAVLTASLFLAVPVAYGHVTITTETVDAGCEREIHDARAHREIRPDGAR